jgi:hypothetical protein
LRSIPGMTGASAGFNKYHLMVQPFFFCASNHSIEPEPATARFGEVDKAVLDDPPVFVFMRIGFCRSTGSAVTPWQPSAIRSWIS